MATVLIADAGKASLVMSSEIFKDKIPGSVVYVAGNGKDCIELAARHKPDMCVVDFDLPDVDGISLIHALREFYRGPILLTAYPDRVVSEAVAKELFAFNDSGAWLKKPVDSSVLEDKIDTFLLNKHRLGRRFPLSALTQLIGKSGGRGKRAPKIAGEIVNVSLGGVCVRLDLEMKFKDGQEFTLGIPLTGKIKEPVKLKAVAAPKGKGARKGAVTQAKPAPKRADVKFKAEDTFKAKVCWAGPDGTLGLQFTKLSDSQRKGIESLLKRVGDATSDDSSAA